MKTLQLTLGQKPGKGRDNSLLGVGAGGRVQDGAKARAAARPTIQMQGQRLGAGRNLMGNAISALGEGWSNGEDQFLPWEPDLMEGYRLCLGEPHQV